MQFRLLLGAWLRMLREYGHSIAPRRYGSAALLTFTGAFHSIQNFCQNAINRDALARIELAAPPIFVIGHWRSGTTLLHELLCLDPRHAAPTTYACMNPSHFLITAASKKAQSASRRPMDDMTISTSSPQEDEFALLALGALSPYVHWMFPAALGTHPEYLDLDLATREERERWVSIFMHFMKQLTLRDPRRLVVKSPPHSFRVRLLHEMFPGAVFVHIVRDPYAVFASTRQLYRRMFELYALTDYSEEALDEYILAGGVLMERLLDAALPALPAGQYCRVRYEELIAEPVQCMKKVYDSTRLGAFESARAGVQQYFESHAGFRSSRHELTLSQSNRVTDRWRCMFEKYAYATTPHATMQVA